MNRMGLTARPPPGLRLVRGLRDPGQHGHGRDAAQPGRVRLAVDESDAGPYPIPAIPKIEGAGAAGDRHILMVDTKACRLWELFAASKSGRHWSAGSGAIWDLRSNALRPDGWTSADAAGLPIYPGLARYDEVAAGVIAHALRFTAPETRTAHIYPARHDAGVADRRALPADGPPASG